MDIKELLDKLSIPEDKADSASAAIREFLNGAYVPKSRFNEVNEEKNTLKAAITDRDKQLEALKKSTGDVDSLKAEIKNLQDRNKAALAEAEAKMKDLRMNTAIKLAIGNDAQDADIVASLIQKDKLILGEDGNITGLAEQVKALKEGKPFLFKDGGKSLAYNPHGGTPNVKNPFAKDTFNLTEAGKLLRDHPEEARQMAAAAGVTL